MPRGYPTPWLGSVSQAPVQMSPERLGEEKGREVEGWGSWERWAGTAWLPRCLLITLSIIPLNNPRGQSPLFTDRKLGLREVTWLWQLLQGQS